MKKLISTLLAAAVIWSVSLSAVAATPSFSDVPNGETAAEVDVLRMLGVIDGTGATTFQPNGSLTRAQFCKMVMIIMDQKDQELVYRTRTIFTDVASNHWARGYVNLAASTNVGATQEGATGTKLIRGTGNGQFHPDRAITYGEAVTILIRVLGYSDGDAGMLWPQGYLNLAVETGLAQGLSLSASASVTRAQAAHLFCNLLKTPEKNGAKYLNKLGTVTENAVILALDVKADDGTPGAIRTSNGTLLPAGNVVPQSILGKRGTLVQDAKGKVRTFLPDGSANIPVVVATCDAGWITDAKGTKYIIPTDAVVYTAEGTSTFDKEWVKLLAGTQVTLYTSGGKVSALYMGGATAAAEAVVVMGNGAGAATFASITGGATQYKIYKNGEPITFAEIRKYDVATYSGGVLNVCDQRISGLYENASPNQSYPTSITMFGQPFDVLTTGVESAAKCKVGDSITLLLTVDGKVAGVATAQDARANMVGILKGGKVTLLGSKLTLDCTGAPNVSKLEGQLVTASSYKNGSKIVTTVTALTTGGAPGTFDVKGMKLGTHKVTAGVALYDKVGNGFVQRVKTSTLTQTSVSQGKILYYHLNSSDMVDAMVLDDVTGDCYAYGIYTYTPPTGETSGSLTVRNSGKGVTAAEIATNQSFETGAIGGVADNAEHKLAGTASLTKLTNVTRSEFVTLDGRTWVNHGGMSIPVADQVECYNKAADSWFVKDPLTEVRAFSDNLTVYYDRNPDQGGKVRLIVAN